MNAVVALTRVVVEIDGMELSDSASLCLEEVRVQQRLSEPGLCELRFHLQSDPQAELPEVEVGASLEVSVGDARTGLFRGEVTALEYDYAVREGRTLRVRGYDRLHRLRKQQPVRTHVEFTPAELARELSADLGLSVEAQEEGPLSKWILQYAQSNLKLLVDVARRCGLYLVVRGDVLRLLTLEGYGDPIELTLGDNLLEARVEANADGACRSVSAKGWDPANVKAYESRADGARTGRSAAAEAAPDRFGNDGERTLAGEVFASDADASAVAQAELDRRSAREVTLRGVAEGDAALCPGCRVEVAGIERRFAGTYVLCEVNHRVDRRTGYVSEISSVLPQTSGREYCAAVAWGTVTSVDDPEQMGRVRVSLAAFGDVETDWAPVLSAGAGSGKGFVILPDVGDQVLLLFVNGELSQAVVLGGLYGSKGPGDYGVDDASVRRYTLGTSGGQKIRLDDSAQLIRLENKSGSYLEFSPEKFVLHAAVPVQISAPGNEVVISGKSIDFRQA